MQVLPSGFSNNGGKGRGEKDKIKEGDGIIWHCPCPWNHVYICTIANIVIDCLYLPCKLRTCK